MNYYVIQVQTRGEGKYIQLAEERMPREEFRLLWPRRKLSIRKRGVKKDTLAPIFPGYVFLEIEEILPHVYWGLRKTPGFFRFLKSNDDIRPLSGTDRELLEHFLRFGPVADKSQVYFDEEKRIRVIDGPLKGLEGMIVKVDKRKGRAKVRLQMYENSFLIDFGFEALEPHEKQAGDSGAGRNVT
jgi:transcriptional antiterminator NusG